MIPRIITKTTVTVHLDNEILVANESHPAFSQIRSAAMAQDWASVKDLIDVGSAITRWSDNEFTIEDNSVLYKGERVPDCIEAKILLFMEEEAPFEHLLAFYKNLQLNPSRRSIEELYAFLEHESIPIGEDGCFYAYKSVRNTWMDWHSNTCSNRIGTVLSMPRNRVDDDANRGCSYGYHVGSLKYASSFGGKPGVTARLLIVKVNPKDVVSVPHDCAHQKVRTSSYEVVQEYTGPLPETTWSPGQPVDDAMDALPPTAPTSVEQLQARLKIAVSKRDRLEVALAALISAEESVETQYALVAKINAAEDLVGELECELDELGCELDEY